MKTIRKNLLLFILLMSIVSMNLLTASTNSTTSGANEIRLRGLTDDPRPRVPPAPSLEAYLDYDAITIYFLNDLGNISITITGTRNIRSPITAGMSSGMVWTAMKERYFMWAEHLIQPRQH